MQKGTQPTSSETGITEKQLRALSRKHLLMMIRDLELELAQVKEEKAEMILAFRAGVELPPDFVVVTDEQ